MPADSLWHQWLPLIGDFAIPKAEIWDLIGNVLAGVIIGGVVSFFVQKRLFRSQRWSEIQVDAYNRVADELLKIKDALGKIAEDENFGQDESFRPRWKSEEIQQFRTEFSGSHRAIEREVQRGQSLLSHRAARILEAYLREMAGVDQEDTNYPDSWRTAVVRRHYQDFYEVARVDLDADLALKWRARKAWRRFKFWRQTNPRPIRKWFSDLQHKRERRSIEKAFKARNGRQLAKNELVSGTIA